MYKKFLFKIAVALTITMSTQASNLAVPEDFNELEYLSLHSDLQMVVADMSVRRAKTFSRDHFVRHGRQEGRQYLRALVRGLGQQHQQNPIWSSCDALLNKTGVSRDSFLRSLCLPTEATLLEIGPFFRPQFRGRNVKFFDVCDRDALVQKARVEFRGHANVAELVAAIPEINFVDPKGDLSIINEMFNAVYSSHNIEHQVDLVKHLNQVSNVLKDDGLFYLAIPDKRYCFDHFIPETLLSEVLAVHWEGTQTHSLQTILSMRCETGHNDPARHFAGSVGEIAYTNNANGYFQAREEYRNANGGYIDSHKWRFTPASFYYLIAELNKMRLITLNVHTVFDSPPSCNEFYAILRKG